MGFYFSKKQRACRNARKQVLKNIGIITDSVQELKKMYNWPDERLMDAKDRQCEILRALGTLSVNWDAVLKDEDSANLQSFISTEKNLAPYYNSELSWCNATTNEIRSYQYPGKDERVICINTGETTLGWYPRLSADYYVRRGLECWISILDNIQLRKK